MQIEYMLDAVVVLFIKRLYRILENFVENMS